MQRHAMHDRFDGRANGAEVEQLAGKQTLGVVAADRGNETAGDGNDVGGRGADVDENRIGDERGDEGCGGCPVRCGNEEGRVAGSNRIEKATVDRVDERARGDAPLRLTPTRKADLARGGRLVGGIRFAGSSLPSLRT